MKQIAYILIGLLFGFVLAGVLFWVTHPQAGTTVALEPAPTKTAIEVQVVGGVVRPGVYSFPEGSRVQDAIAAAGGLLTGTDPNTINLVAKLVDGQQLVIPGGTAGSAPTSAFSVVPTAGSASSNLLNINTATLEELESLPHIGPKTAQNIIDYRTAHGPFSSITDLLRVQGMGPTTLDLIQNLITTK